MDYKNISDLNVFWDFVKKLKNLLESFWELSYINRLYIEMKLHSNEFNSTMDVEEF